MSKHEQARERREHLGCLLDYWPGESDLERMGNAMEKMLLLGAAYGQGGQRVLGMAAGLLGVPASHAKVLLDILEGEQ